MFISGRLGQFSLAALLAVGLAGCVGDGPNRPTNLNIAPIPGHELKLWTTAHVHEKACDDYSAPEGPDEHNRVLKGYKWPNLRGGGGAYLRGTTFHLNLAAIGGAEDRTLADRILHAARSKALTVLDWEEPGGSSPAFVSTLIVKSTAYAVAYLKGKNALSSAEMAEIGIWIEKLSRNGLARFDTHTLDHKASIAVSRLMWSAATGDSAMFTEAQAQFYGLLNRLKRNPYFRSDLRYNNEVMHHMVHGAYVLHQNGIDVFDRKFGKHSLADAIADHARKVARVGHKKIKTGSDPVDPARSIMRSQGFGTHLAWIPVYLAAAPAGSASGDVRALDKYLRRTDWKPYWGGQMAIHSGCLFGQALSV